MNITTIQTPASQLGAIKSLLRADRSAGLAALNALFRTGTLPAPPLEGRYCGEMIAIDLALFQWLANLWMPWRGKVFEFSRQRGDNIFTKDSYLLARGFNPLYRGFRSDSSATYRAFSFRTYAGPGLFDRDRTVLKINYNLRENPPLTVRRVLDELVQLEDGVYLGKAHVRWWWGRWQTVAYFSLA